VRLNNEPAPPAKDISTAPNRRWPFRPAPEGTPCVSSIQARTDISARCWAPNCSVAVMKRPVSTQGSIVVLAVRRRANTADGHLQGRSSLTQSELVGLDAVVHLAELSNDPLGENDPEITMEINYRGSVEFARNVKPPALRGLCTRRRAASMSGRRRTQDRNVVVRPQTAYARCKVLVESELAQWSIRVSRRCSCAMRPRSAPIAPPAL